MMDRVKTWMVVAGLLGAMQAGCQQPGAGTQTQPMELRGRWIDMALTAADSPTAASLGVPPLVVGVVVAEVTGGGSSRSARAGIQTGDVIVGVNGTPVANLSELYTLSTRIAVDGPVTLELSRRGQLMRAVLPQLGMATAPQVAGMQQPMGMPPPPMSPQPLSMPPSQAMAQAAPMPQSMPAASAMCPPGSRLPGCPPLAPGPMPVTQQPGMMGGFGGRR